jgi:hypothetical protein
MKYITGLYTPRAWFYLLAAAFFRVFQPWRNLRILRTGPIWQGAQEQEVYELIDCYMKGEGEDTPTGYFGKRFGWNHPDPGPVGLFRWRKSRPRWRIGAGFDQVRRFFGDELANPLIDYADKRLQELEDEGFRYTFVELYIFRALHDGVPSNFTEGHTHFLRPYIALFKMERGPSTRVRADGMAYGAPAESLVSVEPDCAVRFTHSWHAGPPLENGQVRFGIVLNARDLAAAELEPERAT